MPESYYALGTERAARVQMLFARIARRYDLLNDLQSLLLHRAWKRKLVRLAAPVPGQTALDLCCGTGDVALALARRGVRTVGLDFSGPMLEVAQRRPARLSPVRWVRGDALRLPFSSAQFDLVTVSYGLRNLADLSVGLEEAARVLKPGGRLLLLDFGKPEHPWVRSLYFAYLKGVVPLFGWGFCGDSRAYAYILESLRHYPGQSGIARLLEQTGLEQVQVRNLLSGMMSIHRATKGGRGGGGGEIRGPS